MKKIILGIFVLLFGITLNAQIQTSKTGAMLGKSVFNIQCKAGLGLVNYDILSFRLRVQTDNISDGFVVEEKKQDENTLGALVYKEGKILANNISLTLKLSNSQHNLCVDKEGFLKIYRPTKQDVNNPEKIVSNMYVEICEDKDYVRFFRAKKKSHLTENNTRDYYILTDIKYMCLQETDDCDKIVFKDQPDGDKSMWKLYRVQ